MNRAIFAALVSSMVLAGYGPSIAAEPKQGAATVPDITQLPTSIATMTASTRERFVSQMMSPFRSAAGSDHILEQSDIDAMNERQQAASRAGRIQKLLKYDLDSNGVVVRGEILRGLSSTRTNTKYLRRQVDRLMTADTDGDGRITLEEILKQPAPARPRTRNNNRAADLLTLDPNGDGRLTGNELEAIARGIFASFDVDGNGHLSAQERSAWNKVAKEARRRQRERPRPRELASCSVPNASAAADIVEIGRAHAELQSQR